MIPFTKDIRKWFLEGVEKNATHMIIYRNLSDGHYEKIFIFEGENPMKIYDDHNDELNYLAFEVYSLKQDMEKQLKEELSLHFDS